MDVRKKLNKGRKHYTYIEVLSALSDYGNYLMGEPAENDFGSSQTVEDYINYNMWHDKNGSNNDVSEFKTELADEDMAIKYERLLKNIVLSSGRLYLTTDVGREYAVKKLFNFDNKEGKK